MGSSHCLTSLWNLLPLSPPFPITSAWLRSGMLSLLLGLHLSLAAGGKSEDQEAPGLAARPWGQEKHWEMSHVQRQGCHGALTRRLLPKLGGR